MNPYLNNQDLKVVVLCAGRGARIHAFFQKSPKDLIPLKKRPLLYYVINFWKKFSEDFIFVVGYKKEKIIKFAKTLPIKATFVVQKKPKGIADAILRARNFVSEQFIVALGDCLAAGKFTFPEDLRQGIGVYQTKNKEDIRQNYSVKIENNLIYEVEEKPEIAPNNLCGMGYYFFDRRVFGYIKRTPASKLRQEIEITDVLQAMIDNQEEISPVFFQGRYININYLADLKRAAQLFCPKKRRRR